MPLPRNRPSCGVCAQPLVKNGKTSAGRTRWRCRQCGASTTIHREQLTRRAQLDWFHAWLVHGAKSGDFSGSARTFRRATAWCWRVPVPRPEPTGVIHHQIMLDGTYFNGWCVLIAYTGTHVVDWQWCDHEKKAAWVALLNRIPAPVVAIIDGGTGLHAALRQVWPHTAVQRCYFHIYTAIRRHLSLSPRLEAGQELMRLTRALMAVADLDQAAVWMGAYATWEAKWETFLKQRSRSGKGVLRPTGVNENRAWWYTHQRLRRARGFYRTLIRHHNLFTWLNPALAPGTGVKVDRTTSPLEGGPNKAIKELLRAHRGMPEDHARRAVDWLLNSLTEHPRNPWDLAREEHWNPPPTRPQHQDEPIGPTLYDNAFSWEDGNGIQHGWAGRNHP